MRTADLTPSPTDLITALVHGGSPLVELLRVNLESENVRRNGVPSSGRIAIADASVMCVRERRSSCGLANVPLLSCGRIPERNELSGSDERARGTSPRARRTVQVATRRGRLLQCFNSLLCWAAAGSRAELAKIGDVLLSAPQGGGEFTLP